MRAMAPRAARALLLLGLLCALLRAQDFDLQDALGDDTKLPTPSPKKPSDGDDFNLEDAIGGGGGNSDPAPPNQPKPRPNPNPKPPGTSGGFSDSDLLDGNAGGEGGSRGGGGGSPRNEDQGGNSEGVVPGIVGAVVVAVAGAISSFIAYQKKKLCFKENGVGCRVLFPHSPVDTKNSEGAEQGDVNMENEHNTSTEPPVQQTLLEK